MAKYLDPKSDLTFKKVFGEHKELLISFLNALLPLCPGKEIISVEYLSSELVPETPTKKDSIVDVRCSDKDGRQFLVEMQMYWTDAFKKRALLNTCKAYSRPATKGMEYNKLKPVYTISLVNDFAFPELGEEFYHEFMLTNRKHHDHTIEDIDMIFIELPKFRPEKISDKKMAVLWLRYLTEIDERTHQAPSELTDDTLVSKALSLLEESAYTDKELMAIDKYWDMVSREKTAISEAEQKGHASANKSIASKMKADGMSIEMIQKYTGLTLGEIEKL